MITVNLHGGLGNQLFQYFFGTEISNTLKKDIQFKIDERNFGPNPISSLFVNTKFVSEPIVPNSYWELYRRIDKFTKINILPLLRYSNYYSSDVTGYNPKVYLPQGNTFYSGYYQTYKYVESAHQIAAVSQLHSYIGSPEYQKVRSVLEKEKPIIVHIRRGDYRKYSDSIGLLSSDYYSKGIKLARELVGDRKIYCMSDEDEFSIKFLNSLGISNVSAIRLSAELDAHETMLLGTTASVNVISNSTFAWWSGYLNQKSIKIAPTKWLKSRKDPEDLIPKHWYRIESSWDA